MAGAFIHVSISLVVKTAIAKNWIFNWLMVNNQDRMLDIIQKTLQEMLSLNLNVIWVRLLAPPPPLLPQISTCFSINFTSRHFPRCACSPLPLPCCIHPKTILLHPEGNIQEATCANLRLLALLGICVTSRVFLKMWLCQILKGSFFNATRRSPYVVFPEYHPRSVRGKTWCSDILRNPLWGATKLWLCYLHYAGLPPGSQKCYRVQNYPEIPIKCQQKIPSFWQITDRNTNTKEGES